MDASEALPGPVPEETRALSPPPTAPQATVSFVMARLRVLGYSNPDTLAYQSKVGPVPWLQPYTDEKIKELAGGGVSSLVVVRTSRAPEPPVAPFFLATDCDCGPSLSGAHLLCV